MIPENKTINLKKKNHLIRVDFRLYVFSLR